jgi:hypothetical protein
LRGMYFDDADGLHFGGYVWGRHCGVLLDVVVVGDVVLRMAVVQQCSGDT